MDLAQDNTANAESYALAIYDKDGQLLVGVKLDGEMVFSDIYEPNETAKIFWNAMYEHLKTTIAMPRGLCRMQSEIDDLLNACVESEDTGESKYPGMTYEQGVSAAINWLQDRKAVHPLED